MRELGRKRLEVKFPRKPQMAVTTCRQLMFPFNGVRVVMWDGLYIVGVHLYIVKGVWVSGVCLASATEEEKS